MKKLITSKNPQSWEKVIDFVKIKKGGIDIEELLAVL